ncbi:uncharacterized protein LOC144907166 [Branchiostoma floridae x Branchiostoma belcheri]
MTACRILWVALLVCHAASVTTAVPADIYNNWEDYQATLKKEAIHLKAKYEKCEKALMEATNKIAGMGTYEVQLAWTSHEETEQTREPTPQSTSPGACVDDYLAEKLLEAISNVQRSVNGLRSLSNFRAVNLAHDKYAKQVNTKYEAKAKRSVDGDSNTNFFSGSCSYTHPTDDAWWYVDLEEPYAIGEVKVYNNDRWPERINPFNIIIGNSSEVDEMSQCGGTYGADYEDTLLFQVDCGGMYGRYVGVRLPGSERSLMMCEVRVYEYTGLDPE